MCMCTRWDQTRRASSTSTRRRSFPRYANTRMRKPLRPRSSHSRMPCRRARPSSIHPRSPRRNGRTRILPRSSPSVDWTQTHAVPSPPNNSRSNTSCRREQPVWWDRQSPRRNAHTVTLLLPSFAVPLTLRVHLADFELTLPDHSWQTERVLPAYCSGGSATHHSPGSRAVARQR
jgi:hypothetical protein